MQFFPLERLLHSLSTTEFLDLWQKTEIFVQIIANLAAAPMDSLVQPITLDNRVVFVWTLQLCVGKESNSSSVYMQTDSQLHSQCKQKLPLRSALMLSVSRSKDWLLLRSAPVLLLAVESASEEFGHLDTLLDFHSTKLIKSVQIFGAGGTNHLQLSKRSET